MKLLCNDLLKFRRSHMWAVLTLVPLIAVAIGGGNYAGNQGQLDAGWTSYLSQIMLFYGMIFMTAGIAIIASAAWRVEHRGHNWHSLLTSTRSAGTLTASKIAAITIAVAAMQAVLVVLAIGVGFVLGVPGTPPGSFSVVALLSLLPAAAVSAWQSFLSMVIRNFTGPVALALVASIFSFGALASGATFARFVLPPGLLTDTLWLGSSAVAEAGTISEVTIIQVTIASTVLTLAGWLAATAYLRATDVDL